MVDVTPPRIRLAAALLDELLEAPHISLDAAIRHAELVGDVSTKPSGSISICAVTLG
jgi:hypothetical protein